MFSIPSLLLLTLLLVGLVTAADYYKALERQLEPRVSRQASLTFNFLVSKHASEQDIKKAYKRLSKKYHPDKNSSPGAEEKFVHVAQGEPDLLELSN